jgi:hypothetical protein
MNTEQQTTQNKQHRYQGKSSILRIIHKQYDGMEVDINVVVVVIGSCDCCTDALGNFLTSQHFTGCSRTGPHVTSLWCW